MNLLTRVLAGEASGDEKSAVNQWLLESEENKKEFDTLKRLWGLTGNHTLSETLDIDKEWAVLDAKISPKKKVLRLQTFIRVAASIIVVLGLSYFGIRQFSYKTIKSDLAKIDNIELPDGSMVSLNANSSIRYANNFGSKNRKLVLKGEGFFNVASNKELPFIISAGEARVQVVGTQFNVKAYKHDPEVTVSVIEGKVDLFTQGTPSEKVRIVGGESARIKKSQEIIKKLAELDPNDFSWKTMDIVFENNTLQEVAKVLENTYHYNFELSEKVKDCTITVEFENQNISSVLKVLQSTLNLEMEQKGKTILISGEGCVK